MTTLLHDIVIDEHGARTQLAMVAISSLQRGKQWRVMVKENKARRSLWQNSYYHAVVVKMVADHTGDTPADTHEWFKKHFLPKVQRSFRGDEFKTKPSTTEMNRGDFWDYYIERIRAWAATELGLRLPDPDPHWKKNRG